MKIVHAVEAYLPLHVGMQEVVTQLSERMVQAGHEVIVVTRKVPGRDSLSINGVKIIEFDIRGNLINGLEGEVQQYVDFLLNEHYDVLTLFAAQQWACDIALPLLPLISARKVFVPTGFSALHDPAYTPYFAQMRRFLHYFDVNVFNTEIYQDFVFAGEVNAPNITLIPNGADERQFTDIDPGDIRQRLGIAQTEFLIMHVGTHTGMKGHDEAIEMFARAEITDAVFVLNGNTVGEGGCAASCAQRIADFNSNSRHQQQKKRIVATNLGQVDKVALLKAADLFLFPSNIESSPIVIFEAMAAGTPFLATEAGNISEIVAWSGGGKLIPSVKKEKNIVTADISAGASLLTQLWQDRELCQQLAQAGRRAWETRFTWSQITAQFLAAYQQSAEEKRVAESKITVATNHIFTKQEWLPAEVTLVPLEATADYYLQSTGKLPEYYYAAALHALRHNSATVIYPTGTALRSNRSVDNADMGTLPLSCHGEIDPTTLLTRYRASSEDVLLSRTVLQAFDHGRPATLSRLQLDYVPVYKPWAQFDTMQLAEMTLLLKHLAQHPLDVIRKRRNELRVHLVSLVNRYKPSRQVVQLISAELSTVQRRAIFYYTFGSVKLDCILIDTKSWLRDNLRIVRSWLGVNYRYLRRVVGIVLKY